MAASVFLLFVFITTTIAVDVSDFPFSPLQQSQIANFRHYLQISTAHPTPDYTAAVSLLSSIALTIPNLRLQTLTLTPTKPLLLLTLPGLDPSLPSLLLNSHLDSVPSEPSKWSHPPFSASYSPPSDHRIFARGAQDDKSIAIQYIEALRVLTSKPATPFSPLRTIHVSLVPDEEIGGADGWAKFVASEEFKKMNVGFVLDEGQASPTEEFRVFYADRSPWSLVVKAVGAPGHGSKMYEGSAMENVVECMEAVAEIRAAQFEMVKAGMVAASEVVSVNPVYVKAGTPSPTGFVMNMQPSEAEVGFDVRLPPTADLNVLIKKIEEEWASPAKNLTYQLIQKGPIRDTAGRPLVTATNDSNPWWTVFKEAVLSSGGRLGKPEILSSTTDARFMRQLGIPTLGFSPMANTPILLHDHNEFLNDTVFLKGIEVYERVISSLSSLPAIAEL